MTETPPQAPNEASIMALVDLLMDAEKRLAAGPWDRWDEPVLIAWRDAAKARLRECLTVVAGANSRVGLLGRWLAWYEDLSIPRPAQHFVTDNHLLETRRALGLDLPQVARRADEFLPDAADAQRPR